jgi:hypothetical protein
MGAGTSKSEKARVDRTRNGGVQAVERIEAYFLDPLFCDRLAVVETNSMSQLAALEDAELKRVGIRLGFKAPDTGSRAAICGHIRRHWCARRRMVFQALKMLEDFDRRMDDVLKGGYCFDDGGLLPRPGGTEFSSSETLDIELGDPEGCMPGSAWKTLTAADQAYKASRISQDQCTAKWKEPIDETWVRGAKENKAFAAAVDALLARFDRASRSIEDLVTGLCVMRPLTPAAMTVKFTKLKDAKASLEQCLEAFVQAVEDLAPLNPIDLDRIEKEKERQRRFTREALKAQRAAASKLYKLDKESLQVQAKLIRSSAIGPPS